MFLPFDTHVHTYYSPCARQLDEQLRPLAAPERYYQRAAELGLEAITFTDHMVEHPAAAGMVLFYKGSGPEILCNLRSELNFLEPPEGCKIYIGCETELLPGNRIGISRELAAQLDFVLVPTTHYHLRETPQPKSFAPHDVAEHMLTLLELVAREPWVDAIAHPFADPERIIGDLRRIYEAMDKARLEEILGLAAQNGVALEVNGSSVSKSESMPHYGEVYREIVGLAKKLGVRFTYGSDAHKYQNLGMSAAVEEWIRSAGLTARDFITPAELRAKRGRS